MELVPWSPTVTINTQATESRTSQWAGETDWAAKKDLIIELYAEETLPRVIKIMREQHKFMATTKMYKSRISRWGLDKRGQQREKRLVDRKSGEQQPAVKRNRTSIRSTDPRIDILAASPTNKGGQMLGDYNATHPLMPVFSRSSMTNPKIITTPGLMGTSQQIINRVHNYYQGQFESEKWLLDRASLESSSPTRNLDMLATQCLLACRLFARNHFQEAGRALISATDLIKSVIHAEHPLTLIFVLSLIRETKQKHRHEIALAMLRQFSALAEVLLGDQHPLCQICRWLTFVVTLCFDEVAIRCLQSMIENFANNLGPLHWTTLEARRVYIVEFCGFDVANAIEELMNSCERNLGTHDYNTLALRLYLADCHLQRKPYVEAKKLSYEILDRAPQTRLKSGQRELRAMGLRMLAFCKYGLQERDLAEANLLEAISLRFSDEGIHDAGVRLWLVELEEWMCNDGRFPNASEVKARREAMSCLVDILGNWRSSRTAERS